MRNTIGSRRRAYVRGGIFARAAAVLILVLVALVGGTSGCDAACTNEPSIFCSASWSGPSLITFCSSFTDVRTGAPFAAAASFYGCNIPGPDGPLPYPSSVGNSPIPTCGAGFCALSTADAEVQAGAQLGYPSGATVSGLQCFLLGHDLATATQVGKALLASWPPSLCVSQATDGDACNPCDDGQGDTLQGPGRTAATPSFHRAA